MKKNIKEPWLNKPNKYTPKGASTQELEKCMNWNSSFKRLTPQARCRYVAGLFDELRELCYRFGGYHSPADVNNMCSVADNFSDSLVKCRLAKYAHSVCTEYTSDTHSMCTEYTSDTHWIHIHFSDLAPCKNLENAYNQNDKGNILQAAQGKNNAPPLKKENKTQKDTSYLSVCKKENNSDTFSALGEGREKSIPLSSEVDSDNKLNFKSGEASLFRDCLKDENHSDASLSQADKQYLDAMYNQLCTLLGLQRSAIADKSEGIKYIKEYDAEYRAPIQDYFQIIGNNANGITSAIDMLRKYSDSKISQAMHEDCNASR